ncbi:MAG TPA: hypothetical protein VKE69_04885, partial [Planctomycetota bacterium]|nr:hypothetical protein [Planctomycetota bacterium]
ADSLNDTWAVDQQTTIGGVRVRIHVEDENRKFNLLSLVSKDADFAKASYERLVRILDRVREATDHDIDNATAETLATNIRQWIEGSGRDDVLPRPGLSSNQTDSSVTLPLTIDELLLVEGIDEELLYDRRIDGVDIPGLASVLTVWTSVEAGPIVSEDAAAQQGGANATPQPGGGPVRSAKGSGSSAAGAGGAAPTGAGGAPDPALAAGRTSGVKINLNTAPPCVLRSLLPSQELPTDVIDAILRWRNQLDEDKLKEQQESGTATGSTDFPTGVDPISHLVNKKVAEGESPAPTHYFGSVDDLDKVDEWKNFSSDSAKRDFRALVTTKSDVFTIDVTVRPEENQNMGGERVDAFGYASALPGEVDPEDLPGGIVKRVRQVVWRRAGGTSEPALLPIVVREERYDRKLTIADFPIDPKTGYPAF